MLATDWPLILAGPVVRRVEPRLAAIWVALRSPCSVRLDIYAGFEPATTQQSPFTQATNVSLRAADALHIALVVAENVTFADIQENVSVSASGLLRELRVFDVYRGPGIDFGRKSVALGLILQDSSRTLTDDDADAVVAAVVARLQQELSATIRDQ